MRADGVIPDGTAEEIGWVPASVLAERVDLPCEHSDWSVWMVGGTGDHAAPGDDVYRCGVCLAAFTRRDARGDE